MQFMFNINIFQGKITSIGYQDKPSNLQNISIESSSENSYFI